ncbi:MAG TPA: PEGA domain-containing protein [Deltaproteobacteria bacterium]|nr:PEGA domain-containing protein [Deltaproteobacteria bacterium]
MASAPKDPDLRRLIVPVVVGAVVSGGLVGSSLSSLAVLAWSWDHPAPELGLEPSAPLEQIAPSIPVEVVDIAGSPVESGSQEPPTGGGSPEPVRPLAPDDLVLARAPLVPGELPDAQPLPVRSELQQPTPELEPQALRSDRIVVRIHTLPTGAQISLDGRSRGRSPAKLMVNPGSYKLTLSSGKAKGSFRIDAGEDQRLCYEVSGKKLRPVGCGRVLQPAGSSPP